MAKAIIFDTETTGINDPEIIEAAWIEPMFSLRSDKIANSFYGRFKPSKPISLSAMAVHHIMDEDLENCPPSSSFSLPDDIDYLIGHNIDFDWCAAGKPEVKRICTLALSRHLWPELESHTQSAMIYFLERDSARRLLQGKAHSAFEDVLNCLIILGHIVKKLGGIDSWETLWKHSEIARIPTVMPFGKHKGTPIKDVPADYKRWLLNQPDIDQYLMKAIQQS
ncbi:MAG: DUF3820 family protein [Nitrosomonas sp.]|nr:DUF3820 family protein [Nitrosomonas sp.]